MDGERSYVRTEDLDELAGAKPTKALRLLPGSTSGSWAPGTDDPRIVAPARRAAVSRQAGWISPVVVLGGVVAGTWELDGSTRTHQLVRRGRQAAETGRWPTEVGTIVEDDGARAARLESRREIVV